MIGSLRSRHQGRRSCPAVPLDEYQHRRLRDAPTPFVFLAVPSSRLAAHIGLVHFDLPLEESASGASFIASRIRCVKNHADLTMIPSSRASWCC